MRGSLVQVQLCITRKVGDILRGSCATIDMWQQWPPSNPPKIRQVAMLLDGGFWCGKAKQVHRARLHHHLASPLLVTSSPTVVPQVMDSSVPETLDVKNGLPSLCSCNSGVPQCTFKFHALTRVRKHKQWRSGYVVQVRALLSPPERITFPFSELKTTYVIVMSSRFSEGTPAVKRRSFFKNVTALVASAPCASSLSCLSRKSCSSEHS